MKFKEVLEGLVQGKLETDCLDLIGQDIGTAGLVLLSEVSSASPNKTVVKINLRLNKITKIPNGVFSGFTALREISLQDNLISIIEANAFFNKEDEALQIEKLNLINNPLIELPEAITRLLTLKKLLLHDTRLSTLPVSINRLSKLEVLGLMYNKLTKLPSFAEKMPFLEQLSFDFLVPDLYQTRYLLINNLHQLSVFPTIERLHACVLLLQAGVNQLKASDLDGIDFKKIAIFMRSNSVYTGKYLAQLFIENAIPVEYLEGNFVISRLEKDFVKQGSQLGISEERDRFGGIWYGRVLNFSVNTWGGSSADGIKWAAERLEQFSSTLDSKNPLFSTITEAYQQTSGHCSGSSTKEQHLTFYEKRFASNQLTLIPCYDQNHSIGLALLKKCDIAYILICDRDSKAEHNIHIYQVNSPEKKIALIRNLIQTLDPQEALGARFLRINRLIAKLCEGIILFRGRLKPQKYGNCSFINVKSLVFPIGILLDFLSNQPMDEALIERNYMLYKQFTDFVKRKSVDEFIRAYCCSKTGVERRIREKFSALYIARSQKKTEEHSKNTEGSKKLASLLFHDIFADDPRRLQEVSVGINPQKLLKRFLQ